MSELSFDPFSIEYTADPRDLFARLQADGPFHRNEALGSIFVHRYEEVRTFTNHPNMTSDMSLMPGVADNKAQRLARWPVTESFRDGSNFSNPESHSRMRKLLAPDFKPSMIRRMAATVEDVVAKHCAALQSERDLDVIELVQQVPLTTISRILGIDESSADAQVFLQAAPDYFRGINPLSSDEARDITEAAAKTMFDVLSVVVAERQRRPQEDLISQTLDFARNLGHFTVDEITHLLVVLLAAGTDTTRLSSSLAIRSLLRNPDRLEQLRADRSLMDSAILELLRYDSPTKFLVRITDIDFEWKGEVIPRGTVVMLSTFAAGLDRDYIADPHVLDFTRDHKGSLSFGYGAHYCLGVHLAKLQISQILNFFLDHMPPGTEHDESGIEWAPENLFLREITRLPIRTPRAV